MLATNKGATVFSNKLLIRFFKQNYSSQIESPPGCNIHWTNKEKHEKFGSVYKEKFGPDVEITFVSDPEICEKIFQSEGRYPKHLVPRAWELYNEVNDIKRGPFFANGKEWFRMRSSLNKVFLKANHKTNCIGNATKQFVENMTALEQQGEWNRLEHLEQKLSLWSIESILWHLFGPSLQLDSEALTNLVNCVQNVFEASAELQYKSSEEELKKRSKIWNFFSTNIGQAMDIARTITRSNIKHCEQGLVKDMSFHFDHEEIETIVTDLIIAAADTTSITALWTLYCLSLDKSHQEEISLNNKTYAKWCLNEAMRLYPVAPFITRILPEDLNLGCEPNQLDIIKAGQLALMSTFAMGRDSKNFVHPELFWPRRWERNEFKERIGVKKPFAFLPFGHGARGCIGKQLAMDEILNLVCSVLNVFELRRSKETNDVEMTMRYTGIPNQVIGMEYKKRT